MCELARHCHGIGVLMLDCLHLGELSTTVAGNRLCHHPQVHAGEAGIPERFCQRCPHRTPLPATLFATLTGGRWAGHSVALDRVGDTWQGAREGVSVVLTRTGDSWTVEATIAGARQSVGTLAHVSTQPLVLHWRALGRSDGALDAIVTT